uniref:Uncharacterized protein n=1 Tax=Coccidioides posadasii RMSCC 3488 TaxID=454284 RepID=A0A0J6FU60_COCPO|nr:hypothetical protein CPAG_09215 [Coccidioides posadasii RMSCC 3488]
MARFRDAPPNHPRNKLEIQLPEDERECKMRTMLDRHLGRFPEPLVAPEQEYQTNQDDLQRSVKRPVAFTDKAQPISSHALTLDLDQRAKTSGRKGWGVRAPPRCPRQPFLSKCPATRPCDANAFRPS